MGHPADQRADRADAMSQRKVLYSPGFGAGWMTWNRDYAQDFLFDADLIATIEHGDDLGDENDPDTPLGTFKAKLVAKHGEAAQHVYLGGAADLEVQVVDGPFRIHEYDGSESVIEASDQEWF